MRIISNNRTDNYSNYLERKKGIVNYNKIITSQPILFNKQTNNFRINHRNQIVKSRSYNLVNNINKIKPYFNNKCWPNNNKPNKTLDLTSGQISIFDYDNSQNLIVENNNSSNINIFSLDDNKNCSNFVNSNSYFNNINHIITNDFIDKDCILNFLIKNLSDPTCPTSINIFSYDINFNKLINIFGENSNTFVDKGNVLRFENIERYNIGVYYGFTLSGQTLTSIKQFNRQQLSISNELINNNYITNLLYSNNWNIDDINFTILNTNFSNQINNVIYPEYNYKIYNYFMKFENNDTCIRLIDLSFNSPPPTRSQVNNENYNITLNNINRNINSNDLNILSGSISDISYYSLAHRSSAINYNVFFVNSFTSPSIDFNFNINKIYKIFIGKTANINETNVGIDLSGNLSRFIFNIKNKNNLIVPAFTVSSEFITGYDESFETQTNKSITSSSGNFDISLSNSLDIANFSQNISIFGDKIKNYYLGIDICNIQIQNLQTSDLELSSLTTSDICLNNKFTLNITQEFSNGSQFEKDVEFIVNKIPSESEKIDICGEINFFSPPNPLFFNRGRETENYFFGTAYLDLSNLYLSLNYDISLINFNSQWSFNNNIGNILADVSFDYRFNSILTTTFNFEGSNNSFISNPLIDNSFITEIIDICINNITDSLSQTNIDSIYSSNLRINYFLSINSNINFNNHPFYNFTQSQILLPTNPFEIFGNNLSINRIINNPINNFNTILNNNFANLILCKPGTFNIINSLYPNWDNFENTYDHTQNLDAGQLLWSLINNIENLNINGFTTSNNIPNPFTNYTNYFGNSNNNLQLLENSGNNIISIIISNFWDVRLRLQGEIATPPISENYKFITIKINLSTDIIFSHHIILITVYTFDFTINNYRKLELNREFIMYMCETNNYYTISNSGFNGRTAWLNASKLFESGANQYRAGRGCYNNQDPVYPNSDNLDYEILIPNLTTRSSTAVYFKIGLPFNSSNNISQVNVTLPPNIS